MVEMTLCDFHGKVKSDTVIQLPPGSLKMLLESSHHDVKLPKLAHPRDHLERPHAGFLLRSQAQVPGDSPYQPPDMLVNIPEDSNSHPLSPSS